MRTVFREDHESFRSQVRRFVDREIAPHHPEWERNGIVPRDAWLKAGEAGLLCCGIPNVYGGGGGDFGHGAIIIEELARVNANGLGFPLHSDIIAPYILQWGTEEQKNRWLPGMAQGKIIAAIAMTEPGAGSDLKSIRCTARRDGDDYVINGQKTFISNGHNADLVIVVCKTNPDLGAKGISLIAVEAGTQGFAKGRKLEKIGLRAQDTAELFFSEVRVPASNLIGAENEGFSYIMNKMTQERLVIAVRAAASIEHMLARTIVYTRQRPAFGKTIFDFQDCRFRLAHAEARSKMLRAFVDQCLELHLRGELTLPYAAMAKLNGAQLQNDILDDCLQLHGGTGYMTESVIGSAWTDARVMRIYGGADEIMKEIIARSL
jgi:acyl-CoA dehydrogenase